MALSDTIRFPSFFSLVYLAPRHTNRKTAPAHPQIEKIERAMRSRDQHHHAKRPNVRSIDRNPASRCDGHSLPVPAPGVHLRSRWAFPRVLCRLIRHSARRSRRPPTPHPSQIGRRRRSLRGRALRDHHVRSFSCHRTVCDHRVYETAHTEQCTSVLNHVLVRRASAYESVCVRNT